MEVGTTRSTPSWVFPSPFGSLLGTGRLDLSVPQAARHVLTPGQGKRGYSTSHPFQALPKACWAAHWEALLRPVFTAAWFVIKLIMPNGGAKCQELLSGAREVLSILPDPDAITQASHWAITSGGVSALVALRKCLQTRRLQINARSCCCHWLL